MTIMLDSLKNSIRGLSGKVAAKATEVNSKMAQKNAPADEAQYIVGLDVGTEFVKALVGKVTEDGIEIIGASRAHQGLSDMQAGAIADIGSVVENCDKALAEAEGQAGISVRTAVIGIAGELVKGTTTTVRVSRKDANKALDLPEVQRIIKLVQQRAEVKAKQQLAWELGGKAVEVKLVNSALVGIEIDGYKVTSPIGFQGKEVVVQLYTAFAPLIHIGALEQTAQRLDLDLLAVAAEPFAVARSVIGDDTTASMNAILMDIGGGTTDIAVITDGGVQGTKMFGIGGRAYTRAIERDLNVEFSQAEALKVGLSQGRVPQNRVAAVEGSLKKTLDVWMSGVELALGEFDKLDNLPHKLLLCGGGSSLDLLMERLESTPWYSSLPFTRKPSVQHIHPDQVVGIIDKTGNVTDHTFITAMGLLRVGLDTLQFSVAPDKAGSLREKIDKALRV
jgi:cell division protein FtsA